MFADDRRSVADGRRVDRIEAGRPGAASAPVADPYLVGWLGRLGPGADGPRLEYGVIVDVVPGGYAYRVSAGPLGFLWCTPGGTAAGFGSSGPRPVTSFPLGAHVCYVRHPGMSGYGTILAAIPHWMVHTGNQPAEGVWPFFRTGQVEGANRHPVDLASSLANIGEIPLGGTEMGDFSAGRAVDSVGVGEWGVMAETGVGIFSDQYQAFLRVDEETGVFAFYQDQMLRVSGHNYQYNTCRAEAEDLDDAGELTGFSSSCVYPWEAYGLWRYNQLTAVWENKAEANTGLSPGQGSVLKDPITMQTGTGTASREPEFPDQMAAARKYGWEGYLGQGGKETVAAPAQLDWAYPEAPPSTRNLDLGFIPPSNVYPAGRATPNGETGPATSSYVIPPNRRLNGPAQPGLYDKSVSLTGGFHLRSARRIVLAKRPSIPTPRPVLRPEDPQGDGPKAPGCPPLTWKCLQDAPNVFSWAAVDGTGQVLPDTAIGIGVPCGCIKPTTPCDALTLGDTLTLNCTGNIYRPSGLSTFGPTGAAHKVTADLAPVGGSPHRVAMLPDALAYAFNWEGLHPFAYHGGDWEVAQEGDAGSGLVNQKAPDYNLGTVDQYLAAPTPTYVDVDHRYGLSPVYENEAGLAILDDGSVVLYDGWGSEIRMTGGNVEFHPAFDMVAYPGRDMIVWAGHDAVIRAHDSVDLSAANGDLRTKAERNSHHLAGNGGCGGFLFESKAVCPVADFGGYYHKLGEDVSSSGFTVLVPKSQFWVNSADALIAIDAATTGGRIMFDAGTTGYVFRKAHVVVDRVEGTTGAVIQLFTDGTTSTANEFTAQYVLYGAPVKTGADRLAYLTGTYLPAFDAQTELPPGGSDSEYSCRTATQYRTTGYAYWQPRWRSIADGASQTLNLWNEPAVKTLISGDTTYPHPGERWVDTSGGYRYYRPVLTDPGGDWVAVDRDVYRTDYENPTPLSNGDLSLASWYGVPTPAG